MPIRTTPELVAGCRGIEELDPLIDIDLFIAMASSLVDEVCLPVVTYDADRLLHIETLLATHFYSLNEMVPDMERAGQVWVRYQNKVDLGFDYTSYGQNAMRMDTAGGLAAINAQSKASSGSTAPRDLIGAVHWIGTDYEG